MKKRILVSLSLAAAMLAGGGAAMAGSKSLNSLNVNAASRIASGAYAETHNTANFTEYMECGSNGSTGFCTLVTSSGTQYSCMTTDPALIEVIRSMSDESYISLSWNASGTCTYMLSYASSRTQAKAN